MLAQEQQQGSAVGKGVGGRGNEEFDKRKIKAELEACSVQFGGCCAVWTVIYHTQH